MASLENARLAPAGSLTTTGDAIIDGLEAVMANGDPEPLGIAIAEGLIVAHRALNPDARLSEYHAHGIALLEALVTQLAEVSA